MPRQEINNISLQCLDHYQREAPKDRPLVLSGYSLASALLALYMGVEGQTSDLFRTYFGGVTAEQAFNLIQSLNTLYAQTGNVLTSNHILIREDFKIKEEYAKAVAPMFAMEGFSPANIGQALARINDLVNTNTKGMIPKLLDSLEASTVAVILNTLYFKADWAYPFDASLTMSQPFTGHNGQQRSQAMMTQHKNRHMYTETADYQHMEMDYADHQFAMGIILPQTASQMPTMMGMDLPSSIKRLISTKITKLQIPKFKAETTLDLRGYLSANGLGEIFNELEAGPMTESKDLAVSQVIQKAVIEVDERGTTAAFATAVTMKLKSLRFDPDVNFIADHPFVFYLRHKQSDTILFMGLYQ